jgi:hypothetical protein
VHRAVDSLGTRRVGESERQATLGRRLEADRSGVVADHPAAAAEHSSSTLGVVEVPGIRLHRTQRAGVTD